MKRKSLTELNLIVHHRTDGLMTHSLLTTEGLTVILQEIVETSGVDGEYRSQYLLDTITGPTEGGKVAM